MKDYLTSIADHARDAQQVFVYVCDLCLNCAHDAFLGLSNEAPLSFVGYDVSVRDFVLDSHAMCFPWGRHHVVERTSLDHGLTCPAVNMKRNLFP